MTEAYQQRVSIMFSIMTFNKHHGSNIHIFQKQKQTQSWNPKAQKRENEFDRSRTRARELDRSWKWTQNRKDRRWITVKSKNIGWNGIIKWSAIKKSYYLSRIKNKTETAKSNWNRKTLRIWENCDYKGFWTRNVNLIWHLTINWIREGETVLE